MELSRLVGVVDSESASELANWDKLSHRKRSLQLTTVTPELKTNTKTTFVTQQVSHKETLCLLFDWDSGCSVSKE